MLWSCSPNQLRIRGSWLSPSPHPLKSLLRRLQSISLSSPCHHEARDDTSGPALRAPPLHLLSALGVTHFYSHKNLLKNPKPYKTKPIHPCRTNPLVTVLPAESCLWLPASASMGNVAPLPTPRDSAGCMGYLTNLTCCPHQRGAPQHGPAELRASTCARPSHEELS